MAETPRPSVADLTARRCTPCEGGVAVLTAAEVAPLVQSGQLRYREDIVDGLENAPTAFLRLFRGENFGKLVVRVG